MAIKPLTHEEMTWIGNNPSDDETAELKAWLHASMVAPGLAVIMAELDKRVEAWRASGTYPLKETAA